MGKDTATLTSREQIHAEFGPPVAVGTTDHGDRYEEFRTRQKFAYPARWIGNGMGFGMTFGLSEVIFFPRELYLTARGAVLGQTLRVLYDTGGRPGGFYVDGEPVNYMRETRPQEVPAATESAAGQ